MPEYLLDTNAFSEIISPRGIMTRNRFRRLPIGTIGISSITRAEFEYGMALNPEASGKARAAAVLFEQIDVLSWTSETALIYGKLRAEMRRRGNALGSLDMLIAAQALEAGAILVTSDQAFRYVPGLRIEDWREP